MTCQDIRPSLSAFHDGELGRSEAEAVREHLIRCVDCRRAASELRGLSRLLAAEEPVPALSAGFTDAVLGRIRGGEGIAELRAERAARTIVWAAAAAVLLAVGATVVPRAWLRASPATLEADAAPSRLVDDEIRRNDGAEAARALGVEIPKLRHPAK